MLRKVQQFSRIPYFMDKDRNMQEVLGSPEFWFSMPGAGAKAHMDAHCESTMSIQLDGTKRWRIGLASTTDKFQPPGTYGDGQAYKNPGGWTPTYDFNLTKGEALFFPPAFIHESNNVGTECAASITHQYSFPMAAGFFRAWWPRIRRVGDMNECWGKISSWATLGKHGVEGTPKNEATKHAASLFASLDTDENGVVTIQEMQKQMGDLEAAQNSMGFHDTNHDGKCTKEEFLRNYALWSSHEHQVTKETGQNAWSFGGEGGEDGEDGADGDDEGGEDEM